MGRKLAVDSGNTMAANLLTHTLRLRANPENAAAVEQLLAEDPEELRSRQCRLERPAKPAQEKAEEHFREALQLDPDSDMAREGLLESFRARSRFYRWYLSYTFFMQRFRGASSGHHYWYLFALPLHGESARKRESIFAGAFVILWLALVMGFGWLPALGISLFSWIKCPSCA